jgi:hypothetical protein
MDLEALSLFIETDPRVRTAAYCCLGYCIGRIVVNTVKVSIWVVRKLMA